MPASRATRRGCLGNLGRDADIESTRDDRRDDDRPCRWRASFPARAAPPGRRHPHRSMTFSGVDEDVFRSPPPASTPPRFVASPHASASAEARESTCGLDAAFNRVVFEIQQRLHLLARGPKIRVQFWLRKLHEHVRPRTVTPRIHTRARTRHRDDPRPNQNPDPESTECPEPARRPAPRAGAQRHVEEESQQPRASSAREPDARRPRTPLR